MPSRPEARDLPDDLALPLASGAEWWYWLGGRPAIDLVNTLRERWRRRVESLVTPDDLGLWVARAQRAPARGARVARGDRRVHADDARARARARRGGGHHRRLAGARGRPGAAGRRRRRHAGPRRARARRSGRARARRGGARRRPHAGDAGRGRADPRLRLGDVLGALLRPLAGRAPALVLDGAVRQRGQGPPLPRALAE